MALILRMCKAPVQRAEAKILGLWLLGEQCPLPPSSCLSCRGCVSWGLFVFQGQAAWKRHWRRAQHSSASPKAFVGPLPRPSVPCLSCSLQQKGFFVPLGNVLLSEPALAQSRGPAGQEVRTVLTGICRVKWHRLNPFAASPQQPCMKRARLVPATPPRILTAAGGLGGNRALLCQSIGVAGDGLMDTGAGLC